MIAVRALGPGDHADVLRINAAAGASVFQLDPVELSRLTSISSLHLVAWREGGAVAGYMLAFSSRDGYDGEEFLALRSSIDEPFWYVDQIAVAGRFRGMGVGRRLYEALASGARRSGVAALCCEVNTTPPNPGSLAFHLRLGFRQVGALSTLDGRTVALLRQCPPPETEGPGPHGLVINGASQWPSPVLAESQIPGACMLTIRKVDPEELPMGLLLLADPSERHIRRYLSGAHAFVGVKNAVPVSVLVTRWRNAVEAEIMNVAVAPEHQRTGIGRAMMDFAAEDAKVHGATSLAVGTGNSSLGELRFYQRLGFRITGVSRDYFADYDPPIFEEGIRCLDMIHLRREL